MSLRGLVYRCVCQGCGVTFEADHPRRNTCSAECEPLKWRKKYERVGDGFRRRNAAYKKTNRARCSERERLRKAKIKPGHRQFVEPVDRDVVYAAHGGCCGICKQFVPRDDFEVDHTVPLSRGGLHGYINTTPSHPTCNRRKYNKVLT